MKMAGANGLPGEISPLADLAALAVAEGAADLARRAEVAEAEAAEGWHRYTALVQCVGCAGRFDASLIAGGRCEQCRGQDDLALRRERDDLGRLLVRADALIAELLLVAAPRRAQTAGSWVTDSRDAIAAALEREANHPLTANPGWR